MHNFAKSGIGQSKRKCYLAHTVPVVFSVNSHLVSDSVLFLSVQLNIEVMAKLVNRGIR